MAFLRSLEALAARRVEAVFAPVHQRLRHATHARRGISEHARLRTEGTWWGQDPRWFTAGTPPRLHNRVTPLVDGERFFTALAAAIAGARDYIYVAGWCLTPHIALHRDDEAALLSSQVLTLLNERARELPVRILLWSGAIAILQPTRGTMRTVQATVQHQATGDLQCRLDHRSHFSHCHHQKAIAIDGSTAFVGGMDLTTYQGDRWDRQSHPLRAGPNWHDVQLQIDGEAAADVEHNFRQRWIAATGDRSLPHREARWDADWRTPVQIVRTVPHHVYPFAPRGEFGIHHAYLQVLKHAQRYIYLENQYLWSPEIRDVLLEAIKHPPSARFRIVIVLPAHAYSGKWDNDRHVTRLRAADAGRGILAVYALYASGPSAGRHPVRYRPVYVHAKVGVIDDQWFTAGSANLNERGLASDTELNAVVSDPDLARALRIDLWAEHLALPRDHVAAADPIQLIDAAWKERASANAEIVKQGIRPLVCSLHRYEIGHMPGSWLLEEAEALTLEH
jgi:phosphatidylserine/phosphatidylglycerophosphate/cardiolipin synthase-like enzyme